MPTFNPPTHQVGLENKGFWSYFQTNAGLSVVRVNGTLTLHPYPENPDLLVLIEGTDYFLGGRTYTVTQAVANELTAAGFGSGIS